MEIDRASENMCNTDMASLKEQFLDWSAKNSQNELNIFIAGKTGVGKSRLVNCLVGKQVAEEGRQQNGRTSDVTPYSVEIHDTNVRVWDSPGLEAGTCDEKLYLTDLADKMKDGFDVMIYCIKMDDKRFYLEDKRAMQTLTTGFGENLWKTALIALTFANRVEDPDGEDELAYFSGEKDFWEKAIKDFLHSELNVPPQVLSDLPIVAAGNRNSPRICTGDDWLTELWTKCLCKTNRKPSKRSYSTEMADTCSSGEVANDMPITSEPSADIENQREMEGTLRGLCCIGCGIFRCS